MIHRIKHLLSPLFVTAFIPFLFIGAKTSIKDTNKKLVIEQIQTIEKLKAELSYYKRETECYEGLLERQEVKSKVRGHKARLTKKQQQLGLFNIAAYTVMTVTDNLQEALKAYNGPPNCLITSAYRPHCTHSMHSKGKAIDIRWNEEGKLLAEWLDTDVGVA